MSTGTLKTAFADPHDPDDYLKGYTDGFSDRDVPLMLIWGRSATAAQFQPSWAIGYLDGATDALVAAARMAEGLKGLLDQGW